MLFVNPLGAVPVVVYLHLEPLILLSSPWLLITRLPDLYSDIVFVYSASSVGSGLAITGLVGWCKTCGA